MNKDILQHLSKDPIIKNLLENHSLAIIQNNRTMEHELCASIISQQLSVKAAATIYQRFLDLFPKGVFNGQYLIELEHTSLRNAGLSNNKVNYVKNVVQFFKEKGLGNEKWEDQADDGLRRM